MTDRIISIAKSFPRDVKDDTIVEWIQEQIKRAEPKGIGVRSIWETEQETSKDGQIAVLLTIQFEYHES